MTWERWAMWMLSLVIGVIVIPAIAWVVRSIMGVNREIANMRIEWIKDKGKMDQATAEIAGELAELIVTSEERHKAYAQALCLRDETCVRHQQWNEEMQKMVTRLDRNMVRLCEKSGAKYEAP